MSVPLVQTVPLVGIFFRQHFPTCWLIGIPLVGMCHRVVYCTTCTVTHAP